MLNLDQVRALSEVALWARVLAKDDYLGGAGFILEAHHSAMRKSEWNARARGLDNAQIDAIREQARAELAQVLTNTTTAA